MTKPNPGRARNILARLRDDAEPTADDRASDLFDIERERMAEELPRSPRLINGLYTLVPSLDELPAGAELADPDEAFAAELVAEYAEAIERVRDRAQEAIAGGRYLRRHQIIPGPRDLAELVRRDRRDAQHRLAMTQADELSPAGPIRWTPIGAAGLAGRRTPAGSANQQTGA